MLFKVAGGTLVPCFSGRPLPLEQGVCPRTLVLPGFCGHDGLSQRAVPLIRVSAAGVEGFLHRGHGDPVQVVPAAAGRWRGVPWMLQLRLPQPRVPTGHCSLCILLATRMR